MCPHPGEEKDDEVKWCCLVSMMEGSEFSDEKWREADDLAGKHSRGGLCAAGREKEGDMAHPLCAESHCGASMDGGEGDMAVKCSEPLRLMISRIRKKRVGRDGGGTAVAVTRAGKVARGAAKCGQGSQARV